MKGNHRLVTAIARVVNGKRNLCYAFLLLAGLVYMVTMYVELQNSISEKTRIQTNRRQFRRPMNVIRTTDKGCNSTLYVTEEEALKKISSYRFPHTDKYIKDLFPTFEEPESMPDFPRFVTGLSFDHYDEGMRMIRSLFTLLGKRYPHLELYVYDMGLSASQQIKMQECNCTYRKFPFHQFPEHIGIIKNLAWKPLVMQLMVRDHPFVAWVDASFRFTTANIDPIVEEAKRKRFTMATAVAKIPKTTMIHMFKAFDEEPCAFRDADEYGTWFVILYPSAYEMEYLLKPWVSCALLPKCIATGDEPTTHKICQTDKLFSCHRFDQSALSILLHRLYRERAREHVLANRILRKMYKKCTLCDADDAKQYLEGSEGH